MTIRPRTSSATAALVLASALALAGCGGSESGAGAGSPATGAEGSGATVVATTTIWGSVAGQVAECAGGSVTTLMPVGTDPHDYTPSSADVATVVGADVVIANGLGLEEGLSSALASAAQDGATVFEVAPQLDPLPLAADTPEASAEAAAEGEAHSEGGLDPHVWLDAARVATAAELIGKQLATTTGDAAYETCGTEVAAEIRATDEQVRATLAAVPADKRILVTDHDALGYFAAAYDFDIAGVVIPGGSTLAEPSSAELAALATTVEQSGVSAIFANSANPSALVDALAAEVGDVEVVELYVDSLGEPGSGADTYQGLMTTDAQRVADALAG